MLFCQLQAVISESLLLFNLLHFRMSLTFVMDMDYEHENNSGAAFKKKYGDYDLKTAKISMMIINCLNFIAMLTISIQLLCLFYRGLKWGLG